MASLWNLTTVGHRRASCGRARSLSCQGDCAPRHQAGKHFFDPNGQVKILDFGLAKLAKDGSVGTSTDSSLEESLTQVGVIPGTAVYMSPEQARSEHLDVRTDIFSFGVVLFEMATGKKPFTGTNVVMTLHAVINSKPASRGRSIRQSPRNSNPSSGKRWRRTAISATRTRRDEGRPGETEKGDGSDSAERLRHVSGLHLATTPSRSRVRSRPGSS